MVWMFKLTPISQFPQTLEGPQVGASLPTVVAMCNIGTTTQTTVALSSGEAELRGIAAGVAQGIGLQALTGDSGKLLVLSISMPQLSLGSLGALGIGKIRHLDCTDLWIKKRTCGRSSWVGTKMPGAENHADILTIYVEHMILTSALKRSKMKFMEGRPACAPAAMGFRQSTSPESPVSQRPITSPQFAVVLIQTTWFFKDNLLQCL